MLFKCTPDGPMRYRSQGTTICVRVITKSVADDLGWVTQRKPTEHEQMIHKDNRNDGEGKVLMLKP